MWNLEGYDLLDNTIQLNVDPIDILKFHTENGTELTEKYIRENFEFEYNFIRHFCNGEDTMPNMDEAIAVRKEFQETGKFTNETPVRTPTSKYHKFWMREKERCIEGYNLGYDFIPGYLYFYWNYTPILQAVIASEKEGLQRKRGKRIYDFPALYDSDYYWYKYLEEAERRGEHAANVKVRGKGYSYKGASMLNRNFHLLKLSKSYAIADDWGYLTGKDGLLTKTWEHQAFLDNNTEFRVLKQIKDSDRAKKSGYKAKHSNGGYANKGLLSEIIGISLDGDPDKVRGIRGKLALWEESGNNEVLEKAWNVARNSFEEEEITYGLMVGFGTGGSREAKFEDLRKLVRDPLAYNIYGIPNIFEKNKQQQKVSMFIGDYMNKRGYTKDNHRLSNIPDAIVAEMKEREKVKEKSVVLSQRKSEKPLNIEEATLQTGGNPFDAQAALEQLAKIQSNPRERGIIDVGWIKYRNGEYQFNPDPEAKPIRSFPTPKNIDTTGAIEIYEHPTQQAAKASRGMFYLAATDPVDENKDEIGNTFSLISTFIMNRLTGRLVAEYTARPTNTDDYYEQLANLLEYYNTQSLPEINKKYIKTYYERTNRLYLLANYPTILKDQGLHKGPELKKGYKANESINSVAREYLHKWTMKTASEETQEDGSKKIKTYMETIRSEGLLKEIAGYNSDGNFDRVSAAMALQIHIIEKIKTPVNVQSELKNREDSSFWLKADRSRRRKKTRNINGILT